MKINEFILKTIIFLIVLTPFIRFNVMPDIRLEQIVVFLFTVVLFMSFAINNKIKIKSNILAKLIILFPIFILISIFYGYLKRVNFKINDFFELYNVFIYLGIFLIFINLINSNDLKYKLFIFIRNCIAISSIISITQYFNFFNLNAKYVPLIAPTQYHTLIGDYPWPRVVGTTVNPNLFAVLATIGMLISLSVFLKTGKKINILIFSLNFIALLMTLSRSGFVLFLISMFVYLFLENHKTIMKIITKLKIKKNNLKELIIMFLIVLIIFISLFIFIPRDLTWRLVEGLDLSNSSSWQARLITWKGNLNLFKSSPVFGIGPAKSISHKYGEDNEWLLLLRMYGVLGTTYFVLMFVLPIIKFKKNLLSTLYGKTYISLLIGLIFYMIPAAIYSSFQLMPLVMIIAGLAFEKKSKKYEIKL